MKVVHDDTRNEFYRENFIAVDLLEIHLTNGGVQPLYLCSGGFNVVWDSPTAPDAGDNEYQAQGQFMGFSGIDESFDVKVGKFTIYLSGVGNSFVEYFVDADFEGCRVVLHKAFLNYADMSIAGNPILMFDGIIYNVGITESQKSCQVNVECSSLFADFERTAGRKTNNISNWLFQGVQYDTGLEQAGKVGMTEYKWGRV